MASSDSVGSYKPILSLVVFLLTNLIVVFPLRLRLSNPLKLGPRKIPIPLNLVTAPPLAVLLLLAAQAIDGTTLTRGILGADGIQPLDVMALFIGLAYIAISLDATGLLRFLAFYLVSKTNSGKRLYLSLYVLFFAFGTVVGNDPVILSGTAFLAYMTRVAGISPPTAWLFAEFSVANVASTILASSNPTNLVLTGAFQISFTSYTSNVILPACASAILLLPYLLWLFRSEKLVPPILHAFDLPTPTTALVDRTGAIFGSVLLLSTLSVLLATSAARVHVQVWTITVPAALVMFGRDLWWDTWGGGRRAPPQEPQERPSELVRGDSVASGVERIELRRTNTAPRGTSSSSNVTHASDAPRPTSMLSRLQARFPTSFTVVSRLPIPLVPFALSMFVLVQALGSPWISVFASWWHAWADKTGTVGAVFGMYVVTVVGCNFMGTNIGATILLARVLQQWMADASPTSRTSKGAIYALALGSNYGAFSASFSASLAGLLWRTILHQKGIQVRQAEFAKLNIGMNVVAMLGGCAVLLAQVYIMKS